MLYLTHKLSRMKRVLFTLLALATLQVASAQLTGGSIAEQFNSFVVNANTQFNKAPLVDFVNVGGDKRFMSSKWVPGGAANNYGYILSNGFTFNYDFQKQELIARWKDTSIAVDPRAVSYFYLDAENGRHYFVKNLKLDGKGNTFYETFATENPMKDSGKVQLLKYRTVKRIRANRNDYAANFSGDYSDSWDNTEEYYLVFPDQSVTKVKLTRKSFQSAFDKAKVKADLANLADSFDEMAATLFILQLK